MIDGIAQSGAMPVLERLMQFTSARHRLISHNIANLSTPEFIAKDVSVTEFQRALGEAVDARRTHTAGQGDLRLASSSQIRVEPDRLELQPIPMRENLAFHDGSDRNVERTMQRLVENFMTFRTAAQLLRARFESLHLAIRERT